MNASDDPLIAERTPGSHGHPTANTAVEHQRHGRKQIPPATDTSAIRPDGAPTQTTPDAHQAQTGTRPAHAGTPQASGTRAGADTCTTIVRHGQGPHTNAADTRRGTCTDVALDMRSACTDVARTRARTQGHRGASPETSGPWKRCSKRRSRSGTREDVR